LTILTNNESDMPADTWTVAEAKAKFSEVIERAQSGGPQTITRNGRTAVVVVAADEWKRKTRRTGNLAEFFAASPLRGSRLKVKRRKDRPRRVDL
jgi:prevent-host-death family protein